LNGLRPFVPRVFFAPAFSCNAEWLAGKTCCNHIDIALVFFSGTGLEETVNISKDWGFLEEPVFDPLREDFLTELVKLDIPHRCPAQQMLVSQIAATDSAEQRQMTHSQKDHNGSR
tara:strand:- start:33 stop:380 length:348 start_codon:yes stop_codon:yes gene_type:complete